MRKMRQSIKYVAIAYSRFSDMPTQRDPAENDFSACVADFTF